MRGKLFKSIALLCIFAFLVVGCSSKDKDEILIGVMVPTSGGTAQYGIDMFNSYKLAVEEINADGGILGRNVRLFQADDGCDPNMASQAASRLIAEQADFIVGGYCSGATMAAMPQFYDEGIILLISGSNSTRITELGFNQTFMLNSPGSHAMAPLASLCESLGVRKIALIHQGDDYSQNLSDLCEEALPQKGFEIATVQVMEQNAADVSAIVTAIRNSGAEFVYWCGYHEDGSNVIRQLRQGGYEGYIAVGDGSADIELIAFCGEAGEGVYVTSPPFVQFSPGGDRFINDYNEKFNVNPGTYATLAYDTVYVLKEAIESAGSTEYDQVRNAVQDIEFRGLSGFIKFTDDRELEHSNFMILQIRNGEFNLVTLD